MELLFDDNLFVQYHFVFLSPADEEDPDLDESLRGQVNGLLAGGTGNALSLTTGTHTGDVPLRIEWHETEPPLDDVWDDVVEASVDIIGRDMRIAAFDDAHDVRLPVTGSHRVRLCASGFEAGSREENVGEGEDAPDRYLLQLWPAPAERDAIIRVSGPAAQYWHDEANKITAMSEQEWTAAREASTPSDVGGYEPWAPSVGRGLSDERLLAEIPMSLRFELREPLARRACEAAGVAGHQPVRDALDALRAWQPLPTSMTSPDELLARLPGDVKGRGKVEAAVHAVFAAADADSVMNLMPLLELSKLATGMSGEDLVREVCAERGYG